MELILGLIPLALMHVQEGLAEEVRELAGEGHARKTNEGRGSRYNGRKRRISTN